jgi:hypothetical protein
VREKFGLAFADEPVPLVSSDAACEQPLIENPALVAAGRSYVLMYSGGWGSPQATPSATPPATRRWAPAPR